MKKNFSVTLPDIALPKPLKDIVSEVDSQIKTITERDPAADSAAVALLYPGFYAVMFHRAAFALQKKGRPFLARLVSQYARSVTGIEIHPAATIGKRVFIDHGMAVVIGETAVVGDDCTIYQGVTLGGTGKHIGKRHPTIGNGVMIGAGAKVLGPVNIGAGSKIAAGAVVLNDIPENSTAVGIPARVVRIGNDKPASELDQIHTPDPVALEISAIKEEMKKLQSALEELRSEKAEGNTKQ